MRMYVEVLTAVALVGAGVTAGVLLCVAISLVPGFLALPASDYVAAHKLFGRYFDRIMPPVVVATTAVSIVVAAVSDPPVVRLLFALAAAALVGVSLVSQLGNVPINRAVKRLPAGPVPAGWPDRRRTWRGWHLVRTVLALVALVLAAVAATG